MDPGAISGETREVILAGGQKVWVAPTRHGGFCALGQGTGGGCDKLGSVPLNVGWGADRVSPRERMTRPFPPTMIFDRIAGHVNGKYADAVEIRFADGDRHRLELAWVSEPINAGFFRYEIPAERRRAGHEIKAIVALDGDGRVVTQDAPASRSAAPPPDALVDDKDAAVRLATSRGEAILWEAPTRYEGRCAWLEYLGRSLGFLPCLPRGYDDWGFPVRFVPTRTNVLLVGAMRKHVAEVEIQFKDGERMVVTPTKGFLLAELPQRQLVAGRQATTIVLRDHDGNTVQPRIPVAGIRVDSEPCWAPLPLHEEPHGPECL
jgi:hypothetical protein